MAADEPGTARRGRLYGIGVGPGDPELMTLKAHRLITGSPVICVPRRSARDTGYAWGIVRDYVDPARQEVLYLEFPMVRDWERLRPYWDQAADAVWARLAGGLDCAFITEGDPFMYSTFIYVYQHMRQRYPGAEIEVVPGVSSFLAAAARMGVPLGNQDERLAIVAGTDASDAQRVLEEFDTVVFLKVSSAFAEIYAVLERLGLVDRARFIARATAPGQEQVVADIRSLRGQELPYLSLLVVRKSHDF